MIAVPLAVPGTAGECPWQPVIAELLKLTVHAQLSTSVDGVTRLSDRLLGAGPRMTW